jgi:predicted enzyme related to lactoylglutathione lyase
MALTLNITGVALDCDDVDELINFYARITGTSVFYQTPEFACLNMKSYWLTTQKVESYVAPTWPGSTTPKQFHFEISATDLDEAETFVLECGARKAQHQSSADGSFRVYLDPAGHPFCLTTNVPDPASS